jgi:hypothetical protein
VDNETVRREFLNLNSYTYRCTAGHTSSIEPTTKKKKTRYDAYMHSGKEEGERTMSETTNLGESIRSRKTYFESSEDEGEEEKITEECGTAHQTPTRRLNFADESISTSKKDSASTSLSESEELISSMKEQIENLKGMLEMERTYSCSLETVLGFDNQDTPQDRVTGRHTVTNNEMKMELTSSIESVVQKHRRMGQERVGKIIAEAAWDAAEGAAQAALIKRSTKWIRENLYTPQAVLKAMDIAGGTLGFQGLEVLRTVETKNKRYYRGSLLPCRSDIIRCQRIVEEFGETHVPYRHYIMPDGGEGVEFDNAAICKKIIEAYGLTEIAKIRSIRMAVATDGFQMTKRTTVMMGGMKMQDFEGICPITKLPIFSEDPSMTTQQSPKHCFPMNLYICEETRKMVHNHDHMFEHCKACGHPDTTPYPFWKPLDIAVNTDMSGTWKLLDTGGAFKNARYPCINCAVISEEGHKPNDTLCDRWCRELHMERENWHCYHHEMLCTETVNEMQEEILRVSQRITVAIERLDKKTRFPRNENPDVVGATSAANPKSIHYVPTTFAEKRTYSNFITDELILRELETEGDLIMRKERLVSALRVERQCRNLEQKIRHGTPKENALFLMMQAIPCILHCANRVNIKLLSVLLTDGLNNAKTNKILSEHAGT